LFKIRTPQNISLKVKNKKGKEKIINSIQIQKSIIKILMKLLQFVVCLVAYSLRNKILASKMGFETHKFVDTMP